MFVLIKNKWVPVPKPNEKCQNCRHSFQFHDTNIGSEETWECWMLGCSCKEFEIKDEDERD